MRRQNNEAPQQYTTNTREGPHERNNETTDENKTEIARESVNFGFSRSSPRSTIEELSREKSLATDFLLILSLSSRHRGDTTATSRDTVATSATSPRHNDDMFVGTCQTGGCLDPVVISTTNAVDCRCAASRPIREILNAQGWAAQTLTTSSTMVVDL